MKKLILLFLVFASLAAAQQVAPNCQITFNFADVNNSGAFFNGTTLCSYWVLTYQTTGYTAVSVELDSAAGTQAGPGSFGLFTGTTITGFNPSTSVSCGTGSNCTAVFSGVVGWYRVAFTSHSGNGTIQGTLQGYKVYQGLGGLVPSTGSGCAGTTSTPCVVAGAVASGSAPTLDPVPVAGFDGTDVQNLKTDTSGRQQIVGAAAAGAAVAGNPVQVCGSDGTDCRTLKTDASGNVQTAFIGNGTFSAGQQAVTGTAANLGTATARAVCVEALSTNTISVFIGATGVTISTGLELQAGQATCQPVNNTNLIFVVASTTGAGVAWSLVN
jgi:hypothetical protein